MIQRFFVIFSVMICSCFGANEDSEGFLMIGKIRIEFDTCHLFKTDDNKHLLFAENYQNSNYDVYYGSSDQMIKQGSTYFFDEYILADGGKCCIPPSGPKYSIKREGTQETMTRIFPCVGADPIKIFGPMKFYDTPPSGRPEDEVVE